VDDGSTDGTDQLVEKWKGYKNGFEIIYVHQENGGMHTAHNTAYRTITTELNVCIDSDDYMIEDAVESIISLWKEKKAEQYSGIVALDISTSGNIIGTPLPKRKSIRLCDYYYQGGKGDKKLIYRTDVMKRYPEYPVFEGEKFVPLGYKYLLVDQDYRLLILNKPVCVVEYLPDGSTRNRFRQYANNPKGFAFERKIYMLYGVGVLTRYKKCIHYVSNSLMSKDLHFIGSSPKKLMTVLAIPFGIVLYYFTIFKAGTGK
jgi:glycosyltransferase involved in cell wall biosynthesis